MPNIEGTSKPIGMSIQEAVEEAARISVLGAYQDAGRGKNRTR